MLDTEKTLFLVDHLIELFRFCRDKRRLLDGMSMKACTVIQGGLFLVEHGISFV